MGLVGAFAGGIAGGGADGGAALGMSGREAAGGTFDLRFSVFGGVGSAGGGGGVAWPVDALTARMAFSMPVPKRTASAWLGKLRP